jgi:Secretion system C-terminal sorting domain
MKKSFFLSCLIPIFLLFSSTTLHAHAWADIREKCNIWNLWGRFTANAQTTTLWVTDCYRNRRNCGGIFPEDEASCMKPSAQARCFNFPGFAFVFAKAAWSGGIPHGAGQTPSQLYRDLFYSLNYSFTQDEFSIAECQFSHNFDALRETSRTVTVRAVNTKGSNNMIKLLKGSQMKAVIRVDFWRAKDDEVSQVQDELMTPEKIIHSEYVIVTENGVEMSKGISTTKPLVKITDKEINVDLSSIAFEYNVPSGIDIQNELVMRFTSDVVVDEEVSMMSIKQKSDNEKISQLTINSNPTNGVLALTITPKSTNELLNVKIYDINGKLLQTVFSDKIETKQLLLTADMSSYVNGVYMVTLIGNEGTASVKKVILSK